MTNNETPRSFKVFFSYAHEDEDLRNQLEDHLSILKHQGILLTWHDRKIGAGREWREDISENLESAQIILLLISSSFIASDYTYGVEMARALKRHEQGNAVVIPIILRPVFWEDAPFGKLQALPSNARPVTKWRDRDEAFSDIAKGIADAAARLSQKNTLLGTSPDVDRDKVASNRDTVLENMNFRLIQPGTFLMGCADGESDQRPAHEVAIPRSFYMGTYVVKQVEWKGIMDTEPWKGREFSGNGNDYPAVYISWADAKTFISKLNAHDSANYYRLPTEAEWEYAARAGTTTKFSFGDDERLFNAYGWYQGNSYDAGFRHAHEVGLKRPNGWGLYDMHGNIWEWVEDWYYGPYSEQPTPDPTDKILRGGGYDYAAKGAASAFRFHYPPIRSSHVIGFRLVKEPL